MSLTPINNDAISNRPYRKALTEGAGAVESRMKSLVAALGTVEQLDVADGDCRTLLQICHSFGDMSDDGHGLVATVGRDGSLLDHGHTGLLRLTWSVSSLSSLCQLWYFCHTFLYPFPTLLAI